MFSRFQIFNFLEVSLCLERFQNVSRTFIEYTGAIIMVETGWEIRAGGAAGFGQN